MRSPFSSDTDVTHPGFGPANTVLVCTAADKWYHWDLANCYDPEVISGEVAIFHVHHWRIEDSAMAAAEDADFHLKASTGRPWLRLIRQRTERLPHNAVRVTVLHENVDPVSRICQGCGTGVGKRVA